MGTSIKMLMAGVTALLSVAATTPGSHARPMWDTSPVHVTRNVSPAPKVVNLRVGEHRHFDRAVIDLDGKVPGYTVRYVRGLTYEGSGEAVPLRGRKFISITLFPARAHNASGESVYEGPKLQQYNMQALRGVAFTGDYEAQVSLGLALRERTDFRVLVLHSPNRMVIDMRH
jgi:hypothetical protein